MRRKQTLLLGVLALTSISALSGCNQSSGADENTLTVNVGRLRKKLDAAGLAGFIATKFGVGYIVE